MDVSPFAMYDIGAGWLAVMLDFLRALLFILSAASFFAGVCCRTFG
jgi:hypothetical protein